MELIRPVTAIVCFGLPEPQVDDLIEAARGTPFQSARWIVFGRDMPRLGGLAAQWQDVVEVTIALMPEASADMQDAALLILEDEGVSVSSCYWLQREDPNCPLPAIARAARLASSCAPHDALYLLRRLATIGE